MGTTGGTALEPSPQAWTRFTRYEVADGYIKPASGATLTSYKPWLTMDAQAAGPLDQLMELSVLRRARRQRIRTPFPLDVTHQEQVEIADWCTKWGLLGVLHHRVDRVVLAGGADGGRFTFYGEQLVYEKSHRGGWSTRRQRALHVRTELAPPSVTIRHLDPYVDFPAHQGSIVEALTETWWRFFPDLTTQQYFPAESQPYKWGLFARASELVGPEARRFAGRYFPSPRSDDFWEIYREPLDDFLAAALVLVKSIEAASIAADRSALSDRRWRGVDGLSDLTRDVRVIPIPGEQDGLRLVYVSPSLLGLLAQWALVQAVGGRVGFCAWSGCRMPFVGSPLKGYCTLKHRDNAHAARKRQRRRAVRNALESQRA